MREEKRESIAQALLDLLDDKTIAARTDLTEEELDSLRDIL